MGYLPILTAAVTLATLAYVLRLTVWSPLRDIPGPLVARISNFYRLSLVGSGRAPENFRELHKRYGEIVRIGPNHVSVSNASAIPIIYGLGTNFLKTPFYVTLAPFYQDTVMNSLFTERDPHIHKSLKTPVAQLFSMTNMRNFEPYTDECTAIFETEMKKLEGQTIDLAVWLQWYAFDVIASITFRRRFGFMESGKDVDDMIAGLDGGLRYIKIIGQFPSWHRWLLGNRTVVGLLVKMFPGIPDTMGKFLAITEDEVRRYDGESKGLDRTDFLAQLRAKEAKDGKLSHRDIINHLLNNLLAGSDTTAISLRATFYYVIQHKSVYDRLTSEIRKADADGQLSPYITYAECLRLPYLQAVMKEAMRMHPGVAFPLERYVPPQGATILGKHLPGGTIVSMSAPVIHRDTSIFGDDAHQFRPERWLGPQSEQMKLMDRSLLTFGYGARTCIGKNISIMEMGKFVPQVFRHFDIEWTSPEPEWNTHAAWFWKQSDILVSFKLRKEVSERKNVS